MAVSVGLTLGISTLAGAAVVASVLAIVPIATAAILAVTMLPALIVAPATVALIVAPAVVAVIRSPAMVAPLPHLAVTTHRATIAAHAPTMAHAAASLREHQ